MLALHGVPLLAILSHLGLSSAKDALQVSKLQSECGSLYTVVSGDGCWSIADSAKITQAQLSALNPTLNCNTLAVGDGLCLGVPCGSTYLVQSGDGCSKIESDKKISDDLLKSINPGLACADIFPGQKLCVAAPVVEPPSPVPTPSPLPPDAVPTVPCRQSLPVSLGDTCSGLADEWGIQLSQFTAMNGNLNCTNLQPGNIACVFPACEQLYKVQSGDWCSKIEGEIGIASGQLTKLNPGLVCDTIFPNQNLCVEPPIVASINQTGNFTSWKKYPVLSSGDLPKSPLVSFVNANDSRETFLGDMIFQLDSQHKELFARVDLNKDGKLDKSELDTLYAVYPHVGTGVGHLEDTITEANYVANMIKVADTNGDGAIDVNEYMVAVFSAQNITTTSSEIALKARMTSDVSLHQKRFIPLLVAGAVALLGLLAIAGFADMMAEMEIKARKDAGDLLNYLDVTYWDRGNEPEPKCSAYMYYSSSCAALGNSWSSHCSEGGEKVYEESCRGLFKNGAKACGFLGCSSLCYKINTENCDCDALKYTTETHRDYADPTASNTQETGVGPCRNRCRGQNGCVGFTISSGNDDSHVTCKVFKSFNLPQSNDHSVAFKLVGSPVGSGTNPICPRVPDGYFPIAPDQELNDELVGEQLSSKYADLVSGSSLLATRQDDSFDPRGTYSMYVKDQGQTGTCVSHTLSTMVEGSIQHQFNRPTQTGSNFNEVAGRVGDSYLATEDCMPLSAWVNDKTPSCEKNGCAKSQFGSLPYVTKTYDFALYELTAQKIRSVKDHLRNVGPLFLSTSIPLKFQKYARELRTGAIPRNEIYYDNHPRYQNEPPCTPGGHAMTVVGYGHYNRPGSSRKRLYWIVQNSWGTQSGDAGFVYVDFSSLGAAKAGPYGINVKEGTQWFYNDIPPYGHDEL